MSRQLADDDLSTLDQVLALLDNERHWRRILGDNASSDERVKEIVAQKKATAKKLTITELKVARANEWRSDPHSYDIKEIMFDAHHVPFADRPPKYWYDIPKFPHSAYQIDVDWDYLDSQLTSWREDYQLNLEPEFQRAHVWTREQQTAYVEYQLQGGEVGKNIIFNCRNWQTAGRQGQMEIVDGKQRLEAARLFLRDEVAVFGRRRSEWSGHMRMADTRFKFQVVDLRTRADLLRLYLNINAGGTPHTKAELDRVRALLSAELEKTG